MNHQKVPHTKIYSQRKIMTPTETAGKYPKSDSRIQWNSENGTSRDTSDRNGSHDRKQQWKSPRKRNERSLNDASFHFKAAEVIMLHLVTTWTNFNKVCKEPTGSGGRKGNWEKWRKCWIFPWVQSVGLLSPISLPEVFSDRKQHVVRS